MSGNRRCEDNSCSAARCGPPSSNLLRELFIGTEQSCCAQAEVLGTDRPCRGPLEFQRQRADIADGQTLTTSQYSRFHVILQNSRFIYQISFHFFVSFFNFSSHGRVYLAPECPSRQSKIIFRKISAIRLKMVCCMPLSSHKKVPYSKERQRWHAFCHALPRGFSGRARHWTGEETVLRRIQSLEQREGFKKIMRVQTALI